MEKCLSTQNFNYITNPSKWKCKNNVDTSHHLNEIVDSKGGYETLAPTHPPSPTLIS